MSSTLIISSSFSLFTSSSSSSSSSSYFLSSVSLFSNRKNKTRLKRAKLPWSIFVPRAVHESSTTKEEKKENEEEQELSLLTSISSQYNDIIILDTPKSRVLLLDSTHNVHSIYNKEEKWTNAYWDDFATLPPIVPEGPIAILGLGGGTAAHLMLDLWPSLKLEGWEIDEILIDKAREYLCLSELEKCNQAGGILSVHIGDALSASIAVEGGLAGIIVDLFSDGKVLPQLQEVETWLELNEKLMVNGRIMVNCAGAHSERANAAETVKPNDTTWLQNSTIKALCKAFPQNLSWKRRAEGEGENFLALTGPFPDLDVWSTAVPGQLSSAVRQWRTCDLA